MGPLKDDESSGVPGFLRELGFHVVTETPELVVLESDKLRVRFVPSRGPMGAEMSSLVDPDRRWSLPQVLEAIKDEHSTQSPELAEFAAAVRNRFPAVGLALGSRLLEKLQHAPQFQQQSRPLSQAPVLNGVTLVNGVPLGTAGTERRRRPLAHVFIWIVLLLAVVFFLLRR